MEKRHRNVAHFWCDKQVVRFFRERFNTKDYKNLRSIYLALCEIDSDFGEGVEIRGFTKTVSTYSGTHIDTANPYLIALKRCGLINYQQINENGNFGGTTLQIFKWEMEEQDEVEKFIKKSLESKEGKWKDNSNRSLENQPTDFLSEPLPENTGNGKNHSNKNNNTEVLLSINKNNNILLHTKNSKRSNNILLNNTVPTQKSTHKKPPDLYTSLAQKLSDIIQSNKNIKHSKKQIKSWALDIKRLCTIDGVELTRQETVLDWYANNIGGQYTPLAESGRSWRDKFIRIESAMQRSQVPNKDKPSIQNAYKGKEVIDHEPDEIITVKY
jgi:hypothetical protein